MKFKVGDKVIPLMSCGAPEYLVGKVGTVVEIYNEEDDECLHYGVKFDCEPQSWYYGHSKLKLKEKPNLYSDHPIPDFQDKRGRTWECFYDYGYFEMICVRWKDDKSFNSPTSFHFTTIKEAEEFANLIKNSS